MREQDSAEWTISVGPSSVFADTREWVDAKKLVWPLIDQENVRIMPPVRMGDDAGTRSWWQALLDICVYGMGWTDIASELTRWRQDGYTPGSPLERFVASNWGPTVSVLELYLYKHPFAAQTIMSFAHSARGWALDEAPDQVVIDRGELEALVSYARSEARQSPTGYSVEGLGFSLDDDHDKWAWISGSGDGAHISSHFSLEGLDAEKLKTLGAGDYVSLERHLSRLSVGIYEGWYSKLHRVRDDFLRDIDNRGNVSKFEVSVRGLGSLGIFSFDQQLNCFVRDSDAEEPTVEPELAEAVMTTSPRYGFSVTAEMKVALERAYQNFDEREDEPVEELELLVKESIGLAHSLTYCVKTPTLDGLEDSDWCRIGGKWSQGFVIPEGRHYDRVLVGLTKGGDLDPELDWLNGVLNDSQECGIEPWAVETILAIWDSVDVFRSVYALLASYPATRVQNINEFEPDLAQQFVDLQAQAMESARRAKHLTHVAPLASFVGGEDLTAEDLLSAILELARTFDI